MLARRIAVLRLRTVMRILGLMVRPMPIRMAFMPVHMALVRGVTLGATVRRGHAVPVVAKGHALPRRYGGIALQRHGQCHGEDEKQANESHRHGDCI